MGTLEHPEYPDTNATTCRILICHFTMFRSQALDWAVERLMSASRLSLCFLSLPGYHGPVHEGIEGQQGNALAGSKEGK